MARRADPAKALLWRERFARFSSAGSTVAAFCAAEGVSVPSFFEWRRKLRRLDAEGSSVADADVLRGAANRTALSGRNDFAEVRVTEGRRASASLTGAAIAPSRARAIVATTANGVRIEIPGDDEWLVAVALRALVAGGGA
jgi:hypothetical protein